MSNETKVQPEVDAEVEQFLEVSVLTPLEEEKITGGLEDHTHQHDHVTPA
ncbi:MAG: hypothetical protein V4578_26720 [Pseudomonadota bacterium]